MGEVVVNCNSNNIIIVDSSGDNRTNSFHTSKKSFDSSRVHSFDIEESLTIEGISLSSSTAAGALHWPGRELNTQDAWLPVTESRHGSIYSAVFHLLSSGFGFQALLLPVALATLGWVWGIICLSIAFLWQFYTIWLLVNLHESDSGVRYSRFLHLSITAFGEKLGKLVTIFPVMYLSGGTCAMLIITGGGTLQLFFKNLCGDGHGPTCRAQLLSGVEWFLVFTCMAILLAQLPNLNSVTMVSLLGAVMAIVYYTIIWALPISRDRPKDISYHPLHASKSGMEKFGAVLNAIGIIVLSFRGHNVILEIQATLPSRPKYPSHKTMWTGVKISYILIAMSFFPLAIGGFWAYGNKIPANGGMLKALSQFHGQDISKFVMGLIYVLVVIYCLCSFQIYSMIVFDNLEFRYTSMKKQRCPRWLRTVFRLCFGGLVFFVSVAFPFLGSLAPLIGGLTMPLTYVYPCFMWISIKKLRPNGPMWLVNMALGCLGVILCVLLVVAAIWNLADKGLNANFFRP
ncbi:Amino acid transporter, transmembrane domain containing protein [Parasponia andersonii]|uniref:Amino acid transporter, transmembrane domain containing protein n=1 Tax=Parasponia andersonii TaxID=3476 RepID=A0A2P5AIK8_PARAD|nr:Amino acid transporter, transmembrane domain containing protein [Parasponia andersonii]